MEILGTRRRPRCLCLLLVAAASGCLHGYRPVTVLVRDAETKAPLAGAEVGIYYVYFLDPFAPFPSDGSTNGDGRAELKIASRAGRPTRMYASAAGYLRQEYFVAYEEIASAARRKIGDADVVVELFSGKPPTIELIVPNGFRGLIKVEISPLAALDWVMGQRRFPVAVPPNGLVEVKVPAPFLVSQPGLEFEARYASGAPLPQYVSDDSAVALRWLTCTQDQFFVVGTQADYESAKDIVYMRDASGSLSTDYDSIAAWTERQRALR